jgi:CRISPR/Cas system CSM-associated protein Csm2 small subunit
MYVIERPSVKKNINIEALVKCLESCLDKLEKENYWDEDNDGYIFEEVVKAVYGDEFFQWFDNNRN